MLAGVSSKDWGWLLGMRLICSLAELAGTPERGLYFITFFNHYQVLTGSALGEGSGLLRLHWESMTTRSWRSEM
jgi:hypothetical protein